MAARSWRWLRARIAGLLDRPPMFLSYQSGEVVKVAVVPSTRLGYALNPPVIE